MSEQDWKTVLPHWLPLAAQARIDQYVKALSDNEFKTMEELAAASDQTLKDIGVMPGHIGVLKSNAVAAGLVIFLCRLCLDIADCVCFVSGRLFVRCVLRSV